jgi:predicted Zn-dependent protease
MKDAFFDLAGRLEKELARGETLLLNFSGERSDFVRFNKALVRQAGSVEQRYLGLRLVRDGRQASATLAIAGSQDDFDACKQMLGRLRDAVGALPQDPWLLINETPQSSTTERRGTVPPAQDVMEQAMRAAGKRDLVGIYAGGTLFRGFANSLGQRNWHEVDSFNFDWSVYRQGDQAVKTSYAGFSWSPASFAAKMQQAAEQVELLALPGKTIEPGEYRAYLSPRAISDVMGLLAWGGFSARSRQTKQSPLLQMESGKMLAPQVTLTENVKDGIAPPFQSEGFVRPPVVTLIERGRLKDPLVSPRSAKEYGLQGNGAYGGESPDALEFSAGAIEDKDVLAKLDHGLYVSNFWYLNYSDRPAGRITGMTRFATFWVQGGKIAAPVSPMRFDDAIYNMLGENLLDLTRSRELLPDASTYGERQTSSARLPGALLKGLRFTL